MPFRILCAAAALLFASAGAGAADISIAIGADVTSIDPHYHNLTPNNNIAEHIFETLVTKDPKSQLKPALAVSWRAAKNNGAPVTDYVIETSPDHKNWTRYDDGVSPSPTVTLTVTRTAVTPTTAITRF